MTNPMSLLSLTLVQACREFLKYGLLHEVLRPNSPGNPNPFWVLRESVKGEAFAKQSALNPEEERRKVFFRMYPVLERFFVRCNSTLKLVLRLSGTERSLDPIAR